MLTDDQQTELSARVLSFIGMGPDPTLFTQLAGPTVVLAAPAGINGARIASWLLRFALRQSDPALFIRIVRVADSGGRHPDLHTLANALEADPSAWTGSGTDELWVPDPPRRPFIDRVELRRVLVEMAAGNGPAAITVDAPDGQGKRTICDYIRQLAARTESFTAVIERELRAERDRGLLERIAFDIRDALQLTYPQDTTHVEPDRIGTVMARDLARSMLLGPPTVPAWLVINLIDPTVEDGLIKFIDELLLLVKEDQALAGRIRLVLLTDTFSRFQLSNLPDPVHRHALPEVTSLEIREWFAAAVPNRDPRFYVVAADEVLRQLDQRQPPQSQRLDWLARFCNTTHRRLAALP